MTVFCLFCRLNELENACVDIEAEEEVCREAIMKVCVCAWTCMLFMIHCFVGRFNMTVFNL